MIMVNLRDYGWKCGIFPTGPTNSLMDVPGVSLGHQTLISGDGKLVPTIGPIRTGVSIIFPHQGNLYRKKVPAGVYIANAFGKSTGIPQICELGCIETPIAVTNTLNVGLVYDAIVEYMIRENPDIGITTGSVSPIVAECYDGYLNDIQGRHVKTDHVMQAIQNAKTSKEVEEGSVGAATGFQVFQLKSGVGTASRILGKDVVNLEKNYHIAAVVFPNYGIFEDFLFYGNRMVDYLEEIKYFPYGRKKPSIIPQNMHGSIIIVIATDLPLSSHQLTRLAKRGMNGIIWTGSHVSNGSGDFVFAFSTENQISFEDVGVKKCKFISDYSSVMEYAFRAVGELVQEALYKGMLAAKTLMGRDGHIAVALDIADLPKIN